MNLLKQLITASVLFFVTGGVLAQTYQRTNLGVKANVANLDIELQFYSPEILRVIKIPKGAAWSKLSLSVIKTPEQIPFSVKQRGSLLDLQSAKVHVSLDLKTGQIVFDNAAGKSLLSEKENSASFTPFNDAGSGTYTVAQAFKLDKQEPIYGLGQHQRGNLSQRNQRYDLVQANTDDVVPFFQSIKGYGIFWDNYSPTIFNDDENGTSFKSDVGDGIDYYFMNGQSADGVIACMRDLTGQAPMFPLWTFGYWQSKERYKSQDELVDVVKKYRTLQVPLDGIIQDWQYWGGNYLWNAMDFLNVEFSHPQKMINDVHGLNAHMIISIWSSFGPQTKPFKELSDKGMLLNFITWPQSGSDRWPPLLDYPSGVRVYDAYNPEARDIYWKYANKGLFSLGMDGWWMDSTEPDHHEFKPADFDNKTFLGSFRKVRNAYPLMTVGGVFQHQRAQTSAKRVFILTRSAFAGQQRYGANTWSGDIRASWLTLKQQIPTGLNFSLSGIPYWNSDIGGFFLSNFKRKLADPEYRELYTRWIEFGAFCPMMRSHGADAPREIYQFGHKGEKVYDAIDKFIKLRYQLLPYMYSTSRDITAHQSSMMRALMMDFATDQNAWDVNNEFMFGKAILVNPVTSAMYVKSTTAGRDTIQVENFNQVKSQATYLPKGADWYDFWTSDKFTGGQMISKQTPLDIIPLYIKAGSILPMGPDVQFATEKSWANLDIAVYPGADGNFTLYEDENDNYNYEQGKYSEINFHWNDKARTLTISDRKGSFDGLIKERKFNIMMAPKAGGVNASITNKSIAYQGKTITVKL